MTLPELQRAKLALLKTAEVDVDLKTWLLLNERLVELLKIPEVDEYFTLLQLKLPVLYANSKSIQLLQEINLEIRRLTTLENGEPWGDGPGERGVNVHGQFY